MHRVSGNGTPPAQGHTDPDYAPTVEMFDHLTHRDIQRGVQELNPEIITAGRQAWQSSAAAMADAVQSAHTEIRGAIADGWRGGAAQLAADAVTAFERLGQELSDVMAVVGQRLAQANDAAETLRASVSQQVTAHPDLEAALLDPKQATANVAVQKSAENLRQDAVRVMDSVYAGVFLRTGDSVPAFPDGGMYPNPAVVQPGNEATAPGGGSADLIGRATGAQVAPTVDGPQGPEAAPADRLAAPAGDPADGDRPGGDQQATDRPAAVTPAAAASTLVEPPTPVHSTLAAAAVPEAPVAATANPVVTQPKPSNTAQPAPAAAAPGGTPGVVPAAVGPAGVAATTPASTAQNSDSAKRDDHDQDHNPSADSMSGMGAGIVGGLAGGAFAAGDAVRQGPPTPVAAKPIRRDEDEDEDYYSEFDDEPTFLEPAEPGGELVGILDPTTPPVLGEWSEDD
ncbi:WXG100 family type VII secretion target [Nocardia aobensis]|uniref:WXG100 family type VII secretion target n=1 Tax=Nocardia aobensis TaxID=257277 RepID=A0ABW6NWG2_9NOCA